MILGILFFGTTWTIISIIIGIILLFSLGFFYDEEIDGDGFIGIKAVIAIGVSIFWPITLLFAACVGVVTIPIYLGKKIRNFVAQRKEKKIEKENFFKQLEELKKKGG